VFTALGDEVRDLTIDSLRAHKYSGILGMYFLDAYGMQILTENTAQR
jgi:hypothetical protein